MTPPETMRGVEGRIRQVIHHHDDPTMGYVPLDVFYNEIAHHKALRAKELGELRERIDKLTDSTEPKNDENGHYAQGVIDAIAEITNQLEGA